MTHGLKVVIQYSVLLLWLGYLLVKLKLLRLFFSVRYEQLLVEQIDVG